jgi:protein TonB
MAVNADSFNYDPFREQANSDRADTGSGVDARQDLDMGPYLANVKSQIENQWFSGVSTTSSQVTVHFSIDRSGNLVHSSIEASSGLGQVDDAALDAVRRAGYFGPLPTGYPHDTLHIAFTFTVTVSGGYIY